MINLEELIRAELKKYIEKNPQIDPAIEEKLLKLVTQKLRGDGYSPAKIKGLFDEIIVEA